MEYFAGLDVSVKDTSVCIVDDTGKIVREAKVASEPTVDVAARFLKSKSVGAVFGLTCSRDQSGERDRPGAISRCGDEMMRAMLYEAAQSVLVHSTRWSWLKA